MALTSNGLTNFAKAKILNDFASIADTLRLKKSDLTYDNVSITWTTATTSSLIISLSASVEFDNLLQGDTFTDIELATQELVTPNTLLENYNIAPDYTMTEDGKIIVTSASYTITEV